MNKDLLQPPKFPEWILTKLSFWVEKYSLLDDLEEEYGKKFLDRGKTL